MSQEILLAQVERTHRYNRPEFQETMEFMGLLRDAFRFVAQKCVLLCPESRELSLALTKLDEANMFAIAALARFEPKGKTPNTTSHPKEV